MTGRIEQVNISDGGVPKRPVPEAWVSAEGLAGDWQQDREHHGGPERAVCLLGTDVIARLQAEGHPIAPGTTGENLTVSGLDWHAVRPGARLAVGEALELEITRTATPCRTIGASFDGGRFSRLSDKAHPGDTRLYARVLRPGSVRPGDAVRVLPEG